MNLDNGACGPDGCHDQYAIDHGHRNFLEVISISVGITVVLGLTMWFYGAWCGEGLGRC